MPKKPTQTLPVANATGKHYKELAPKQERFVAESTSPHI